jgi:hypothetical protein
LAAFVLSSSMLISFLRANLSPQALNDVLDLALAQASLLTIQTCAYYMALEPYVRRFWPNVLVTWTRLLHGRWCDPRVGRDLLMGSLLATWSLLIFTSLNLLEMWLLRPDRYPSDSGVIFWTATDSLATWLGLGIEALLTGLFLLMFLFLARLALRRASLAALFFVAAWTPLLQLTATPHATLGWLGWPVFLSVTVISLTRFGYLTNATMLLCLTLLFESPLTTDFSSWYAGYGLAGAAAVLALALFGFWTAQDSPPIRAPRARSFG